MYVKLNPPDLNPHTRLHKAFVWGIGLRPGACTENTRKSIKKHVKGIENAMKKVLKSIKQVLNTVKKHRNILKSIEKYRTALKKH